MTHLVAINSAAFCPVPTRLPPDVPKKISENTPAMRFQRAGERTTAGKMRSLNEASIIAKSTRGFSCEFVTRKIEETRRLMQNTCSNSAAETETAGDCGLLKYVHSRWVGRLLK